MNSKELLQEAAQEFASLKYALQEDGHLWPPGSWQQSHFLALVEDATRKKKLAMSMLEEERTPNWWETPDPEPQVTALCPYCGRWYRDDRTICTDGCGGTLTEVKRVSLKARKVSFSNIAVIHADSMRQANLYLEKTWLRATPTTEVKK